MTTYTEMAPLCLDPKTRPQGPAPRSYYTTTTTSHRKPPPDDDLGLDLELDLGLSLDADLGFSDYLLGSLPQLVYRNEHGLTLGPLPHPDDDLVDSPELGAPSATKATKAPNSMLLTGDTQSHPEHAHPEQTHHHTRRRPGEPLIHTGTNVLQHLARSHGTHGTHKTAYTEYSGYLAATGATRATNKTSATIYTQKTHATAATAFSRTQVAVLGLKRKLKRYLLFTKEREAQEGYPSTRDSSDAPVPELSRLLVQELRDDPDHPLKRFLFGLALKRIKLNRLMRFINDNFIQEPRALVLLLRWPERAPEELPPLPTVTTQLEAALVRLDNDIPFWKYHIVRYGKDMYLTTNPDVKHMYCRNGPGFFVEVVYADKLLVVPDPAQGFQLVFKDISNIDSPDADAAPVMIIAKKPRAQGGYFTVLIPVQLRLAKLAPHLVTAQAPHHQRTPTATLAGLGLAPTLFNGLVMPKTIPARYVPPGHSPSGFCNLEFKDVGGIRWNIGNIPRTRASKLSPRLKPRFLVLGLFGKAQESHLPRPQGHLVGKNNVYFHQNYIVDDDDDESHGELWYRDPDPALIAVERDTPFPPVLAVYRPHNPRIRRKLALLFAKNRRVGAPGVVNAKFRLLELAEDLGAGLGVDNYYAGGDGLYFVENPSDDLPDDDKLGWITVYEDTRVFGSHNKGMFDMVVGLTLAAGLDASPA